MKINIGAGDTSYEGFVNCDYSDIFNPDHMFDLEKDKFPFSNDTVTEVIAHHVLEHLGEGYFHCMKELYRVCRDGAIIDIKVPHYRHENQMHDPTHRRFITSYGLKLFDQEFNRSTEDAASKLGLQLKVDFRIVSESHRLAETNPKYEIYKGMTEEELRIEGYEKINIYEESHFKLRVVKPTAIPRILLQVSKNPYPEYLQKMWKDRTDDSWKVYWFDDAKIMDYFDENPMPEFPNIKEVFKSFNNGAHKADLFRYYFMYKHGGVFVDSDAITHVPLESTIVGGHEHFFTISNLEMNDLRNARGCIFNGFFGCVPNSPIVYDLLQDLYNTAPKTLDRFYLYAVSVMYDIVQKHNPKSVKYFYEDLCNDEWTVSYMHDGPRTQSNNTLICTHYTTAKVVPPEITI